MDSWAEKASTCPSPSSSRLQVEGRVTAATRRKKRQRWVVSRLTGEMELREKEREKKGKKEKRREDRGSNKERQKEVGEIKKGGRKRNRARLTLQMHCPLSNWTPHATCIQPEGLTLCPSKHPLTLSILPSLHRFVLFTEPQLLRSSLSLGGKKKKKREEERKREREREGGFTSLLTRTDIENVNRHS
jgi:hypothetical protein